MLPTSRVFPGGWNPYLHVSEQRGGLGGLAGWQLRVVGWWVVVGFGFLGFRVLRRRRSQGAGPRPADHVRFMDRDPSGFFFFFSCQTRNKPSRLRVPVPAPSTTQRRNEFGWLCRCLDYSICLSALLCCGLRAGSCRWVLAASCWWRPCIKHAKVQAVCVEGPAGFPVPRSISDAKTWKEKAKRRGWEGEKAKQRDPLLRFSAISGEPGPSSVWDGCTCRLPRGLLHLLAACLCRTTNQELHTTTSPTQPSTQRPN